MTKIRQYKHSFQLTNLSHDIPNYNLQTTPWTSCTSITCYPNIHNMFCSHFQITTLKHPSGNVHVPKFHLPVTTVTLYPILRPRPSPPHLQTHRILPSPSTQTNQLLQSPLTHWKTSELNRWTWHTVNFWSSRSLLELHHRFGRHRAWINPSLPLHSPRLQCLLVIKKMKSHNFTNCFIDFISRPRWIEMKWSLGSPPPESCEMKWIEMFVLLIPNRGGEMKWSEILVFHENFMKISRR